MSENLISGRIGETIAALFLQIKGYRILARNLKSRTSELDIVAEKSGCLVFAEVKLRGPGSVCPPLDTVDRRKRAHMARGAMQYLKSHESRPYDMTRFDVLSVSWTREKLLVEHIEDAFTADGLGARWPWD
jgi:putative endonuclease